VADQKMATETRSGKAHMQLVPGLNLGRSNCWQAVHERSQIQCVRTSSGARASRPKKSSIRPVYSCSVLEASSGVIISLSASRRMRYTSCSKEAIGFVFTPVLQQSYAHSQLRERRCTEQSGRMHNHQAKNDAFVLSSRLTAASVRI